ncbi:MAG: hypothetical protein ACOH1Y_09300 [Propionicimonas sp.]
MTPQELWSTLLTVRSHIQEATYPEAIVTVPDTEEDWAVAVAGGLTKLGVAAWLDERHDATSPLACPHRDCDGREFVVMDARIRENRLQDPEFTDGHLYLSVEDVDSNFETFGYACQTCRQPVSMPTDGVLGIVWG